MAKIDNAFETTKGQIQVELQSKVDVEKNKLTEKYRSNIPEMDKLQAEIADLHDKIDAMQTLKQDKKTELQNLDPLVSSDEVHRFNAKHNTDVSTYHTKRSQLSIAEELSKTVAYNNITAWNTIKTQINSQYNLAVSAKQKQQVIMNLQTSIDWKALGIPIPNLFQPQKVEIKNGKIILDNALPHKTK